VIRIARVALIPVVVVSAAVLLAGFRGGEQRLSRTAYQQQVQSIYGDVRQAFAGTSTRVASLHELSTRAQTAQTELRDAAKRLDALHAPLDVKGQTHAIAAGLDAYARDLDQLRAAADAGDAAEVQAFEDGLTTNQSIGRIREAAEEIHNHGYNLGALSGE
jgi:hypothetical protein